MTAKSVIVAAITVLLCAAWAQQSRPVAPLSLSQINRLPWPHIGAPPPKGAPQADVDRWRGESATFAETFEAIKGSWTDDEVRTADELRARVRQYEDLLRSVASSAGYGNALLADSLRRLSLTLLVEYELGHPAENRVVGEILNLDRVSLLDSAAVEGLLSEEFKLAPPLGGWKLVENRAQLDSIFRSQGTTTNRAGDRMLFGLPTTSAMVNQRDVYALLFRMIDTEGVERVNLPGLVEFHKRGGRPEDLANPNDTSAYLRVMGREEYRFKFAPLGITALSPTALVVLQEQFDPHGKVVKGFTKLALE
jgi:hypothetical protein